MNTYTLTQAQYEALWREADDLEGETFGILQSLKPNEQGPVATVKRSATGVKIAYHRAVEDGANLYTHPAPLVKEDMVKVLEALVSFETYDTGNHEEAQAFVDEAIAIMQSAIQRTE